MKVDMETWLVDDGVNWIVRASRHGGATQPAVRVSSPAFVAGGDHQRAEDRKETVGKGCLRTTGPWKVSTKNGIDSKGGKLFYEQ